MGRPKYLNCIMTPGIIRSIRQDQENYDKDPAAYEERERQAEEDQRQIDEDTERQRQQFMDEN